MSNADKEFSPEVMTLNAIGALAKAEIDIQVATAHAYPRSMTRFINGAKEMATIDEETAESCIYNRPVGKENGVMKYADGLSVRMSEIVCANYENIRAGATIIEQDDRHVVARGYCHDLERNNMQFSEVVESTLKSDGKTPYTERMRVVIAKSALAKAQRDAVFKVVPRALCRPVERAVRDIIAGQGDVATIAKRRQRVMAWVKSLGIDEKRVFAALGIAGEADLNGELLLELTGIKEAIRSNDTTVDEAFPPLEKLPVTSGPSSIKDLATGQKKKDAEPEKKADSATAVDPWIAKIEACKTADELMTVSESQMNQQEFDVHIDLINKQQKIISDSIEKKVSGTLV